MSALLSVWEKHLMGRPLFEPKDYGVDMDRASFDDALVEEFHNRCPALTIDELLLRPRTALGFCDAVRFTRQWWDVPDDIMLRVLLIRRKNP